ncbi:MAG TPA: DoxX family membrane protein [Thermoanaerobaculia bacterium]|nr:DoxX family membrane protein [Thermoanaerobaculia bacterium]
MLPLIIVVVVYAILTIARVRDWRTRLRFALAVMLFVTASGHWGARRPDLMAMVPPQFPEPGLLVTLTGILEIAGAIGLLIPRTSRLAAALLAVLFVAMFPANVHAARQGLTIKGKPVTALPERTAVQIVLIGAAGAVAMGERRRRDAGVTMTA